MMQDFINIAWVRKFKRQCLCCCIKKTLTLTSAFFIATAVYANPVVDNIAHGDVSIQQTQDTTVINQTSPKAIINWQSFNIGEREATHFQQPAGGMTLNRVNPANGPSAIFGKLTANGQIILINPAGIYFGPSAYVNVGGLIASTANISDQDFLKGYYHFNAISPYSGSIINEGHIIAANHGLIALIGSNVTNKGEIEAKYGHIVLASGNAFTVNFSGNEMINFSVDEKTLKNSSGITNTGILRADGGSILVAAKAAQNVLDQVINMEGIVEARSVIEKNGEIIFSGDAILIFKDLKFIIKLKFYKLILLFLYQDQGLLFHLIKH